MSLDQEELNQCEDAPEQDSRVYSQGTAKQCLTKTSPSGPVFDLEACIQSSTDTSFESSMHRDNIESVKEVADQLLEECLEGDWDKKAGFRDSSLYKVKSMEFKGDSELETVIMHNELMTVDMKVYLCGVMEKEDGLIGLLREAPDAFGPAVTKEIIFVIYHLLRSKLVPFQKLISNKQPLIPKMQCFMDCEGDFLDQVGTSCPVYEEIPLEEVISFAQKGVEDIACEVYFKDIQILNLKAVNRQCKKGVSIIDKFSKLVRQLSKSLFLSLIGATEPSSIMFGLDLSREISFAEISDVGLSAQRSMSRRYVDDEESYDFITKKIKFD